MTNCVRCVLSVEADPQKLTDLFHSVHDLHHDNISPAPHPYHNNIYDFIIIFIQTQATVKALILKVNSSLFGH